jgi:hypothetical protein
VGNETESVGEKILLSFFNRGAIEGEGLHAYLDRLFFACHYICDSSAPKYIPVSKIIASQSDEYCREEAQ